MKKKAASRSGFFHPRVLISFAFCAIGVLPALLAFKLYPSGDAQAHSSQQTQSSAHENVIVFEGRLMPEPAASAPEFSITPEAKSGEIDMAALGIHPLSASLALRSPLSAAAGIGNASFIFRPAIADQNMTRALGVVGANFTPGELVQFFVNGVFAGSFPANADGRILIVINRSAVSASSRWTWSAR